MEKENKRLVENLVKTRNKFNLPLMYLLMSLIV
jgi:hypothetical protein